MRHTKGKQKIEMKKVEAYGDRMITFSKRKSGIFKNMNEIVSLCNVETSFLVFSEAGKPYAFAHPSIEEVSGRFKSSSKHEPSMSISTGPLVEAYKRQKIEELMKRYVDLVEELEMQNEKEKILKESKKEKKLEKMWWNTPVKNLSVEELKQYHQTFVELHASLSNMVLKRFGKNDDGSTSGHMNGGCDGGKI